MFATVEALRRWLSFMRPLVHVFLPESRSLRSQVKLARELTRRVLESRDRERNQTSTDGQLPTRHDDAMTWMALAARGPIDHAAVQLAFAIGALHTTTEGLRMTLLEVCTHPDLLQSLRQEMAEAIAKHGWTAAGLNQMHLLDSVMKESQRFKSVAAGMERLAVRDTEMPDGTKIPCGSKIAVNSGDMWSPEVHENPDTFDGYRFLRLRESADAKIRNTALYASSHKEHNVFGIGRSMCPGRYFAGDQIKLAMAHILLKYDVQLQGEQPKMSRAGFFASTDPNVKVEIRRRKAQQQSVV